jgi:hypothetical protein
MAKDDGKYAIAAALLGLAGVGGLVLLASSAGGQTVPIETAMSASSDVTASVVGDRAIITVTLTT